MEQWNQAFTIYMSVYVEKYPDNTPIPWNVVNQSLHAKSVAIGLTKSCAWQKGTGTQQKPCFSLRYKGVCTI